ncbi:hypothetical protein ACOSQ3_014424 [Xanthoceras sorbifolium]
MRTMASSPSNGRTLDEEREKREERNTARTADGGAKPCSGRVDQQCRRMTGVGALSGPSLELILIRFFDPLVGI